MSGGKETQGWVNTAITASGATLALGMMHLKSNNEAVAQRHVRAPFSAPSLQTSSQTDFAL
jgi:hypothetical protein